MIDPEARLAAFSSLVLQLHREGRQWPASVFQARACELLRELIGFDGCLWTAEHGAPPQLSSVHALGLAPQALSRYRQSGFSTDPVRTAACAAPGSTLLLHGPGALPAPQDAPACGDLLACPGPASALCASQDDALSQQRVVLSLWRDAGAPPFDELDRRLLHSVLPHLVEAHRECALGARAAASGAPAERRCLALCDAQGVLQQIDDHCFALLRQEWPRWRAARLPEALAQAVARALAAPQPEVYLGRQITVLLRRDGDLLRLQARRRQPVDRLSARQRGIAERYADGHTGTQIAAELGLAGSTVNNHLGVIFKKLAVGNKTQLVRLLGQWER